MDPIKAFSLASSFMYRNLVKNCFLCASNHLINESGKIKIMKKNFFLLMLFLSNLPENSENVGVEILHMDFSPQRLKISM